MRRWNRMPHRSPTTHQIFPDAPSDAPIELRRVRNVRFSARGWRAARSGGLAAASVAFVLAGITPGVVAAVCVGAMSVALLTSFTAWAIPKFRHARWDRDTRVTWSDYGTSRGLEVLDTPVLGVPDALARIDHPFVAWVHAGQFGPLLAGTTPDGTPMHLGTVRWHSENALHRGCFAILTLPRSVGVHFPSTSMTRYLRTFHGYDLSLPRGQELRFESTGVDGACRILVGGAPADDVRWRELFDPIAIDGIDTLDVEWQQVGAHVVLLMGGRRLGTAPVETMDTLATAATLLARCFTAAARGDVQAQDLARPV